MSTPDLTRWNRAGLSLIRYVDGNAVTHLERLRSELEAAFPDWAAVEAAAGESPAVRHARMRESYQAPPSDPGLELARALARAAHVLTESIDAAANEGFLPTATQWENVRRLVAMLGYTPAPPASASTPLELHAAEGASGTVRAGFAVDHTPPGGPPVVFETLEDVEIDAALNALRPAGHDRNPAPLKGATLVIAGRVKGLAGGTPVVLEDERTGRLSPHLVTGIQEAAGRTTITLDPPAAGLAAGWTVVHAAPADRLSVLGPAVTDVPSLGPSVELVDLPVGMAAGDVVAIGDGQRTYLRRIRRVRERRLVLFTDTGPLKLSEATAAPAERVAIGSIDHRQLSHGGSVLAVVVPGARLDLLDRTVALPLPEDLVEATVIHAQLQDGSTVVTLSRDTGPNLPGNPQSLFAPPGPGIGARLDAPLARPLGALPRTLSVSRAKRAAAGDLAVLHRAGTLACGRLASVTPADGGATVRFAGPLAENGAGGPYFLAGTVLHAQFGARARVLGWDRDDTPLPSSRQIPLASPPAVLVRGRRVIARRLDIPDAVATTVERVDASGVVVAADVPKGSTRGNLVLAANVVLAGHGRRVPERVLGSGDAAANNQSFLVDLVGTSFVADPTQPAGVRADVEVRVEGRRWQQVATLAVSGPEDPHYEVRLTEDGRLLVRFGDGRDGRRLPTGADNVHISLRQGSGLSGLLPAGSFDREVRGQPLLAAVRQPLATAGGNDRESVEALRESAPAALLTLDRAVSLSDYSDLASSHAAVWQARAVADAVTRGRRAALTVHVVPSGGGELSAEVRATLEEHLVRHGPAGVAVAVKRFEERALYCAVALRVDPLAFDPDTVARAARASLLEALTLPRRRLGQSLSRSDVMRVAENVRGVENSTCTIGIFPAGDLITVPPARERLRAGPHQVIAVRAGHPSPIVTVERALP